MTPTTIVQARESGFDCFFHTTFTEAQTFADRFQGVAFTEVHSGGQLACCRSTAAASACSPDIQI